MALLMYVDNIILTGNDSKLCTDFEFYLDQCFHINDLGALKYFLGIEVARNAQWLFLCQRKYALEIINECGLLGSKPVDSPIELNHKLALASGKPLSNPTQYRRLIGRLIHLTITCPELSYAVHILARFTQDPKKIIWKQLAGSYGISKGILDKASCCVVI